MPHTRISPSMARSLSTSQRRRAVIHLRVRRTDCKAGQTDGAAAAPSPHDGGVGRGPGRGESPENIGQKVTPLFQSTPLPSPLPAAQGEGIGPALQTMTTIHHFLAYFFGSGT